MELEIGKLYCLKSSCWNQGGVGISYSSDFDISFESFETLEEEDLFLVISKKKNFIKILKNDIVGWVNIEEIVEVIEI